MTTEFVRSADGTRVAFARHGSGPPVVFAHGASGDKSVHPELQARLAQTFTVVAYDRRGRGESDDHEVYDFLKEADDLRAVLSEVGGKPIVFGISMGARIALEALRDPPDLEALVLFEAPATDHVSPEFDAKLDEVRHELETKGKEAGTVLHSRLFHDRSAGEIDELRRDPERWKLRVESFPITLREMEAVHRDCLFIARNYANPGLPVHLLTGDATLPFIRRSGELISGLPFVRVTVLEGGDHSAPGNDPSSVHKAFLDAVQPE